MSDTEETESAEIPTDMNDKPPTTVRTTTAKTTRKKPGPKPGATRKTAAGTTVSKAGKRIGRPPKKRAQTIDIESTVSNTVESLGASLMMLGTARQSQKLVYDGKVLAARSLELGRMMSELAEESPQVKAAIERMLTSSSWAKVGVTVAGVAIPIACNHDVVPRAVAIPFIPPDVGFPPVEEKEGRSPVERYKPSASPGNPSNGVKASAASGLPEAP